MGLRTIVQGEYTRSYRRIILINKEAHPGSKRNAIQSGEDDNNRPGPGSHDKWVQKADREGGK